MRRKREKGYWVKKAEHFTDGPQAQARAAQLRQNANISHVVVRGEIGAYEVSYSVATSYLEEIMRAGVTL